MTGIKHMMMEENQMKVRDETLLVAFFETFGIV